MDDSAAHPSPSATPTARPRSAWGTMFLRNFWIPIALAILFVLAAGFEYEEAPAWFPGALRPGTFPDWWNYVLRIAILAGINITLAVSLQLINGIAGQFSLGHAGFMALGAYLGGYAVSTYGLIETEEDSFPFTNALAVAGYFVVLTVLLLLVSLVVFGLFWAFKRTRRVHQHLPTLVIALLGAWWIACDVFGIGDGIGPYALVSRVWIATADAFVATTEWIARTTTPWSQALPFSWRRPITFLVMLVGGGVVAAVAGFVVGLPTLRLRGDYLAIATLGFAEIIRVAIVNSPALGGATGMSIDVYWNPPYEDEAAHYLTPWVFGVALVTIMTVWRIKHSPKGRSIAAVREDEIAAAAIGVDPAHHKVIAFVVGAFFAGVAGALYAAYDGYLNTNSFGFLRSVELVVMVTLGGLGSIWGAAIVAVILTALPEVLRNAADFSPMIPADIVEWRMTIYALLLIGFMLLRGGPWYDHIGGRWRRWRDGRRRQGFPTIDVSPHP